MIRLFVGLDLDAPLAERLTMIQAGLPGARWIDQPNLHLTLVFVGEIAEHQARDLDQALLGISHDPFDLVVSGLGVFGSAKPHSLWAGIEPSEPLDHLQRKITQCCRAQGLEIEKRKFTPHITVAKLRDSPAHRLSDFIANHSPFHGGMLAVSHFTLFQSHLTHQGSQYERVAEYRFRAG